MFLKRLEIYGFKSFADRVTIEFDRGFTAVVGPNGSGKSNITDAIRWVLGEQSAKTLRGGKMEDIIFAGSDTRKPLNFAEVTLTLDNSDHFLPLDYEEISVTRRVYRSGESEFFINKQSCRLKDIVDLFMDSGLGKDGFSIISQGRVDEILNSKPEERRAIFEEAAGVLKYKKRKIKAEANLEETEENLNRVRDILHELEQQLDPLKKQAATAREYLAKKEELEKYAVGLIVYEIEDLHARWEEARQKVERLRDQELELSTEKAKIEASLTQIREKMAGLDDQVDKLQAQLLDMTEALEKNEGKKEVLQERKKNTLAQIESLQQLLADQKRHYDELTQKKTEAAREHERLAAKLAEEQKKLAEKEEELATYSENIQERIESLKADYIEFMNELATAKNESEHLVRQLERLMNIRNEKKQSSKSLAEEHASVVSAKNKVTKELQTVKEQLEQLSKEIEREEKDLSELKREFETDEKAYQRTVQTEQQLQSRIDLLEEMAEDYSGFYQGVKVILKNRLRLPGIEGAVAELIRVDRAYEKALEIALGASLQHIVVKTEADARGAIQFLKQTRAGRATFLPLETIRGKEIPHTVLKLVTNHPSYVGLASDLVEYDSKYSNIIQHLLGNVLISKSLAGANEMARMLHHRYRIVTLDGDVVNPGGAMTGGATKNNSGSLLARKNELDRLKKELHTTREYKEKQNQKLREKNATITLATKKLHALQEQKEKYNEQLQELKECLQSISWQEQTIKEKLDVSVREEANFTEEIRTLQNKQTENANIKKELEEKIAKVEEEIANLTEKLQKHQSVKENINADIQSLRIAIAKTEEQYRHARTELEQITNQYRELEQAISENESRMRSYEKILRDAEIEEQELHTLSDEQTEQKEAIIQEIADRRKERMALQLKQEDMEREGKELERQHKEITDHLKKAEVQLNRLDVELDNRLQILYVDYQITYEGAKEKYSLTVPYEEAKQKADALKTALDRLGVVNLGAIDEYERISERYEFLMTQKDDLETAKDQLYQVIHEMDEVMIERFGTTFQAISREFTAVFRNLFGGGQAQLQLTDPDDLLNTGIEIIAQPPGKKLQTLGLLSGGERALTAIALLFSILRARPVPFCVLDEVEAALDEANVYRFSQYVKAFSEETQFIVITHRKGTMEEADVLYGITMQESGVSKLVSVRLEEVEEHVQMKV